MYHKIMVGYAADRHADDALALARLLASSGSVEEVMIAEALHGSNYPSASAPVARDAAGNRLMPTDGWPDGVTVSLRELVGESPAEALSSTANHEGADLLVLGSTHRGHIGRMLKGTTAGDLIPHAGWPVVIAPPGYAKSPAALRVVGVAFDGSDESAVAVRWASEIASAFSAKVQLIAVVEPPPPAETWGTSVPAETWDSGYAAQQATEAVSLMRGRMEDQLAAASEAVGPDRTETVTIVGSATHELREAARSLDMLVTGSHGAGRVSGALMGSVSRALANSCPAPLAVIQAHPSETSTSSAPPAAAADSNPA